MNRGFNRALVVATLLVGLACCASPPDEHPQVVDAPTATASKDGFVLELWVDRLVAQVADRVTVVVRVTNTGTEAPLWETNTCGTGPAPVEVSAENDAEPGRVWDGNAALFKQMALQAAGVGIGGPSVIGRFWEADKIDGNIVCPAVSIPRPFEPGQVEEATLAWDVEARDNVAIQAGEATLTSTFTTDAFALTAQATIQIAGNSGAAPLVELIDAALGVDAFRAWLERHGPGARMDPNIVYWPNAKGAYPKMPPYEGVTQPCVEIGVFYPDEPENGFMGAVVLDLATQRVIGTRFE
jgi:hypothetical protein